MVYRAPDDQDEGDIETGTRVCQKCNTRKSMTDFYYANRKTCRRRTCKACVGVRFNERRAANPQRHARASRRWTIRTKYGISEEQFDRILANQEGQCRVCWTLLYPANTNIDHDHKSGRVRGLLCFNCNVAIGHFRDNPALMERAAGYIRVAQQSVEDDAWVKAINNEFADIGLDVQLCQLWS